MKRFMIPAMAGLIAVSLTAVANVQIAQAASDLPRFEAVMQQSKNICTQRLKMAKCEFDFIKPALLAGLIDLKEQLVKAHESLGDRVQADTVKETIKIDQADLSDQIKRLSTLYK